MWLKSGFKILSSISTIVTPDTTERDHNTILGKNILYQKITMRFSAN